MVATTVGRQLRQTPAYRLVNARFDQAKAKAVAGETYREGEGQEFLTDLAHVIENFIKARTAASPAAFANRESRRPARNTSGQQPSREASRDRDARPRE